ncbi:MAG: flagellar biosynthetic protein FliR [Roseburia porci]|nr:flagellar biosynthetic protein FliR [Roseburia porci]
MVNYSFSLDNLEYFLLIFVRISCFVYVAPFLGQSEVPRQVKIGLSAFVSLLLYNVLQRPELNYTDVIGYAVIVFQEGITGLLIGFSANICNSIVLFAGNIIDMDIGLSMATIFNPETNSDSTISGNFYQKIIILILIASNMHLYILRAIGDSFSVIPIGGTQFNWQHIADTLGTYMCDMGVIGFRIYLPFFACVMILNCILGIMAKVAPQMNMFAVGMQLKVLVGFAVMFLTVILLPDAADFISDEMKKMVVMIIEGLH